VSWTPIAPGELVTIFGPGVGPVDGVAAVLDSQGGLATSLTSVRVLFDSVPAPLLYVQRNQINLVAPYAVFGNTTSIVLEDRGAPTNAVDFPVALASPAIFPVAGFYQPTYAILNQEDSKLAVQSSRGRFRLGRTAGSHHHRWASPSCRSRYRSTEWMRGPLCG
jgi:uncharacterized protein (TIGR03437 family)